MVRLKEHNTYLESKIQSYTQVLFEKGIEVQKLKDQQETHLSVSIKKTMDMNTYANCLRMYEMNVYRSEMSEAMKLRLSDLEKENARMQKILTESMNSRDQEHGSSIQSYIDKIQKLEIEKRNNEIQLSEQQNKMKRLESDGLDFKSKIQEYSTLQNQHVLQIQDLQHKVFDFFFMQCSFSFI